MEISGICRICLCNALEMHSVSLFYKITPEKTVSDVISELAQVEITEQDLMPKFVCLNCYQTILFVDNYRQLIVKSDVNLKRLLLHRQKRILERAKIEPPDEDDTYEDVPEKVDLLELENIKLEINIKEEPIDNNENFDNKNKIDINNILAVPANRQETNTTDNIQNLKSSSNNNEYGSKTCKVCGKYVAIHYMKRHIMLTHNNLPHTCEFCTKDFKLKSSLYLHKKTKHNIRRVFTCLFCNMEFLTFSELKMHKKCHSEFYCKKCGSIFTEKEEYYSHRLTVHNQKKKHSAMRTIECDYCGKVFKHKKHLNAHIIKHLDKKRKKEEPNCFTNEDCDKLAESDV